jgi:hypothetical protein
MSFMAVFIVLFSIVLLSRFLILQRSRDFPPELVILMPLAV